MVKSKKELSDRINEALGFDEKIDFTKLSMENLIRLYEKVKEPKILILDMISRKGEDLIAAVLTQLTKKGEKDSHGIGQGKFIKKFLDFLE